MMGLERFSRTESVVTVKSNIARFCDFQTAPVHIMPDLFPIVLFLHSWSSNPLCLVVVPIMPDGQVAQSRSRSDTVVEDEVLAQFSS